jgi:hypothetical protein
MLYPTISIFGSSFMDFGDVTACSIPLESTYRAGSNCIELVAIAPKLKNPCPTKPFTHYFYIGGRSMGFGTITA